MRAVVAVPADLVSQSAEGRSQAPTTGEVTESEEGESGSSGHEELPTEATFLNTVSGPTSEILVPLLWCGAGESFHL